MSLPVGCFHWLSVSDVSFLSVLTIACDTRTVQQQIVKYLFIMTRQACSLFKQNNLHTLALALMKEDSRVTHLKCRICVGVIWTNLHDDLLVHHHLHHSVHHPVEYTVILNLAKQPWIEQPYLGLLLKVQRTSMTVENVGSVLMSWTHYLPNKLVSGRASNFHVPAYTRAGSPEPIMEGD